VRAAGSLVLIMAVDCAKHGVAANACSPLASPCCQSLRSSEITFKLRPHTRIFASTRLKTRRITRPGSVILRTAASRHLSSRALPPACQIGRSLRTLAFGVVWSNPHPHGSESRGTNIFFEILFIIYWVLVDKSSPSDDPHAYDGSAPLPYNSVLVFCAY